jgi:maltokinase
LGECLWLAVLDDGDVLTGPLRDVDGVLVRAKPGDGAAACLVQVMASGELPNFQVTRTDAAVPVLTSWEERPMSVDQTHESVVVGDALVVKWSVGAEASPAPSLITHLTKAGFDEMPTTDA